MNRILKDTLNKLDILRNTIKDANEINSYKAKELKDKEQELFKLSEELRLSKAENDQRIKELEENQKLLNSTLQNLAKSDEDSRIKAEKLKEKGIELSDLKKSLILQIMT